MVTNICLISGICVSNYSLVYPALVCIPTNFLIEMFSFFVSYLLDYTRTDLTFLINFLIEVTVSILCWLCVHSLLQQVIDKFRLLAFVIRHWIIGYGRAHNIQFVQVRIQRGAAQKLGMVEEIDFSNKTAF